MSEITFNVKVQGLEQLRETVALLQQLKELGAGNPDVLAEIHRGCAILPNIFVEPEKPWLPDNEGGWIENSGGKMPEGISTHVNVLTASERARKDYTVARCNSHAWSKELCWCNPDDRNNVVAYRNIE